MLKKAWGGRSVNSENKRDDLLRDISKTLLLADSPAILSLTQLASKKLPFRKGTYSNHHQLSGVSFLQQRIVFCGAV